MAKTFLYPSILGSSPRFLNKNILSAGKNSIIPWHWNAHMYM